MTLDAFEVASDSGGSVSLKQLTFATIVRGVDNLTLNNFQLFSGQTDITNRVHIQTLAGQSLEAGGASASGGTSNVVVTFDTEETIPAGIATSYTLKATGHGFFSGDSVSTQLLGDPYGLYGDRQSAGYLEGGSATSPQYVVPYYGQYEWVWANLLWSDNSATSHSYTPGASSGDWFNGFGIMSPPLPPVVITAL